MDVEELPMHKDTYFFGYGIDIENPDEMARQVIELKEENQELKKQLHEASLQIQSLIEEDMTCPSTCSKLRKLRNQQKEFIEWLEDKIKYWEEQEQEWIKMGFMKVGGDANNKIIFRKILEKYKEIVGGNNDQ